MPFPESDRSLDQVVLEYLGSEDVPDDVDLSLTPTPDFVSGRSVQTRLKATSGSPPRPLAGATVQVRILSTSARASTAFEGKTSADGSCPVSFMVPGVPQWHRRGGHPRDGPEGEHRGSVPDQEKVMAAEIAITVNGSPMRVPAGASVADLLERLRVSTPRVAVERNREILPKGQYGATVLAEGDSYEVVELVGGG